MSRGAPIGIFEADCWSQKAGSADPIADNDLFKAFFLKPSFYHIELFIVMIQSRFVDIHSGVEFHFWKLIPLLGNSCERGFLIWRVGKGIFLRHFSKVYIYLT